MIEQKFFDSYGGHDCRLYILRGDGIEVGITDFGAAVQYIRVVTEGGVKEVALGYPTIGGRIDSGTYCGATVGRVANRIKDARFRLDGTQYVLSANDGKNCNHGGAEGFDKRLFKCDSCGDTLKFSLKSPDNDQGFPGNLSLTVEYGLKGKTLDIRYFAVSDRDTLWSPTCHAYFNLDGAGSGDILGTFLKINADKFTLTDGGLVCDGRVSSVKGTPFDFTDFAAIGALYGKSFNRVRGYDLNYILNGEHAATAIGPKSKIRLDVFTDMPGMQFYTGNYLKGSGTGGQYRAWDGFCLEPQFFPNAANVPDFPSPVIRAGRTYGHFIRYVFGRA